MDIKVMKGGSSKDFKFTEFQDDLDAAQQILGGEDKFTPEDDKVFVKSSLDGSKGGVSLELDTVDWGDWDVNDIVDKMYTLANSLTEKKMRPYQIQPLKRIFQSFLLNDGAELNLLFARQCLAEGSVIHTRSGELVRIEDHPDSWLTGHKKIIEIRAKGGRIVRCTHNHPILTDTGWMNAGLLKPGDFIYGLKDWDKFGDGKIPYEYSQYVNKYRTDMHKGVLTMTDELAELVGWLYTDGYVSNKVQSIKFTNNNLEYLDRVEFIVKKYFKDITPKRYAKGNGFDILFTTAGNNGRLNSLKDFIRKIGEDHGFPKGVVKFTRSQTIAFIQASYAADGYIYKRPKGDMEIGMSGSNDLVYAEYYREILNKLGVSSTIKHEKMAKASPGKIFKRIVVTGNTNANKFRNIIGDIPGKPYPEFRVPKPQVSKGEKIELDGETVNLSRVMSIHDAGTSDTYDVEYVGKGWFICGGIQVSNSGKTELVSLGIVTIMIITPILAKVFPKQLALYKKGVHIGHFAPTSEQAYTTHARIQEILSSDLADSVLSDPDIDAKKKYPGGMVKIEGPARQAKSGKVIHDWLSFCRIQTAAKQSKIESKTYHLLFLDEGQEADSLKVKKSIIPMGASTNSSIVMTGTPTTFKSYFYDSCIRNQNQDRSKHTKNYFAYDYKVVQKYNNFYRAHIKNVKATMGADSDEFRMAYGLEWMIGQGMALTPNQFDEYLANTSLELEYRPERSYIYVAGLDLAKGVDSTVLTIGKLLKTGELDYLGDDEIIKRVANWMELKRDTWENQFKTIVSTVHQFGIKILVGDGTGKGDVIMERLTIALEDTNCDVVSLIFTQKSKHEMATLFYEEMNKKLIEIPASPQSKAKKRFKNFYDQWMYCEKNYNGPYMQLEHPKKRGMFDDYVDSLLLMLIAASKINSFNIVPEKNMLFSSTRSVQASRQDIVNRFKARLVTPEDAEDAEFEVV